MNEQTRCFYEFENFRIDAADRVLQRDGRPVPLTLKAFDILLALVQNHGRILEKDLLMQEIWPDSFVEECNLTKHISLLRQAFGDNRDQPRFIETIDRRGYRFVASVRETIKEQAAAEDIAPKKDGAEPKGVSKGSENLAKLTIPLENIEPVGGAVPLDSKFYISRRADDQFCAAIARRDSIILIKGARQIGKTSLLARGLQQARESGAKVILTDFQLLGTSDLDSLQTLFLTLGDLIAEQLDLDVSPRSVWKADSSPNVNFERYIRREALKKTTMPIVWGLDEVDRLFNCDYGSEFFGLFRSWHNMRSLDPNSAWKYLTLAVSYATEAHLFITDANQSPFNVGTQLLLDDFTIEQTEELNRRYGSPLRDSSETERLYELVGGHPFLVRKGLYEIAGGIDLDELERQAVRDDGPFGNHLHRIYLMLGKDAALCDVMRGVLQGKPCPTSESFYRLRSAGLVVGDSARNARPRCRLYESYLKLQLL